MEHAQSGSDLIPSRHSVDVYWPIIPFRDWSAEPELPFGLSPEGGASVDDPERRLLAVTCDCAARGRSPAVG